MNIAVEVITIEDSLGIVLPREVLEVLRVDVGDSLYATITPTGVCLTRDNPDSSEKVDSA